MKPAPRKVSRRALPPLNAVVSFEAAARHESFAAASRELGVTPGAVARAVATLEDHFGALLFHRHGRRLRLSDAGRALLPEVSGSLDRLAAAADNIPDRSPASLPTVHVGCLPTFAQCTLMPHIDDFQRAQPAFRLTVTTLRSDYDRPIDYEELDLDRYDVLITHWRGGEGHHTRELFTEKLALVAAPGWMSRFGNAPLSETPVLRHGTRPGGLQRWCEVAGVTQPAWTLECEHFYLMIEACRGGAGAALVPTQFARTALDSGTLVLAHPLKIEGHTYVAACARAKTDLPPVRNFLDWLADHA